MKRLLAILISILLIFSLCSCLNGNETLQNQNDIPTVNNQINENPSTDKGGEKQPENESNDDKPSNENKGGSGNQDPKPSPDNNNNSNNNNNQNSNQNNNNNVIEIPNVNNIITEHKALSKENYYQRSFLNASEKALYDELCLAAEKCQSVVDVKKYKFNESTLKKVYSAFCADCPQYFYISKHSIFIVDSATKLVNEFIIQYTDGQTIDDFDSNNNPTTVADREKIKNQITEFGNKISAILSHIPSNISELERERKIYDYIVKTVVYDREAESNLGLAPDYSTSFSAYGAACKGKAVCEGYVKLFQFLCYNSGINVTPVESDSSMQHMWAATLIDDNWYMCDITWDDADNLLGCLYRYFNVTKDFISQDHSFGNDLKIPECNSLSASFYNNFAIVPNGDNLPDGYKNLVYNALLNGDEYIYVYRVTGSNNLGDFINKNIYKEDGEFYKYLDSFGYSLGEEYYHTETYYFIPIIKK